MVQVAREYRMAVCGDCIMAEAGYSDDELGQPYSRDYPPLQYMPQGMHAFNFSSIGEDDKHFSRFPCDSCGEPLAGDRYDVTVTEWVK